MLEAGRTFARAAQRGFRAASALRVARLLFLLLALLGNACTYARIFYYNTPTLAAPSYFDSRTVRAPTPVPLPRSVREAGFFLHESKHATYRSFDAFLEANQTRAFVAVHAGAIVYERYFGGMNSASELPAFSISKTYAAALVGCALRDGLIASMDDPLIKYLPELAGKSRYSEVTLDQLLRMISGIDFDEESTAGAALYYATDLRSRMYSYEVTRTPGQHYLYGSVNIQLLWEVLYRRLQGATVSHYFERTLWAPLGAEWPASWSLDSQASGVEKFFGGFNATARDHARLGLLFLHEGTLNGRSIVPREWVLRSLASDPVAGQVHTSDGTVLRGNYQWFLTLDRRAYFAKGYHGQYIFVLPEKDMVFVRFGDGYGDVDWPAAFENLAKAF